MWILLRGLQLHVALSVASIHFTDAQVDPELDCAISQLAFDYSSRTLSDPFHVKRGAAAKIRVALGLDKCPNVASNGPPLGVRVQSLAKPAQVPASHRLYAAPNGDGNHCNQATPCLLQTALARSRVNAHLGAQTIVLADGVYELAQTIVLTEVDSGLTIAAAEDHEGGPILSGGIVAKNLKWSSRGSSIVGTQLPAIISAAPELFINGTRQVLSRYPNANPEKQYFPQGYGNCSWAGMQEILPGAHVDLATPRRVKDSGDASDVYGGRKAFDQYRYMRGGASAIWTNPPWSPDQPFSFDDAQDYKHMVRAGVVVADKDVARVKLWNSEKEDVWVHTYNDGFWGNWMMKMREVNASGEISFRHAVTEDGGGWQDQAGAGWQDHCVWFAENLRSEMDHPGEYFFDSKTNELLYYPHPGVGPAELETSEVVIPRLERLLHLNGTQSAPVKDVTIRGVTFGHTVPTYTKRCEHSRNSHITQSPLNCYDCFGRYTIPGPGDWSIYPSAAVTLQGTSNVTLSHNVFESNGGNSLLMYGYNAGNTVTTSEFLLSGDSAIASVGVADFADGTKGDVPHDNLFEKLHIHNIGIYGKQVSAYFQTLSCHNTFRQNVAYAGPRAGINYNDGFGGGNVLEDNLLFAWVLETNDHGAVNSWDRVPFTTLMGSTPGISTDIPAINHIRHNFIINSGTSGLGTTGGIWNLDHDDGSAYYDDYSNFLVYAGTKNYLGDTKNIHGNVIIQPDVGRSLTPFCHQEASDWTMEPTKPFGEYFFDNICVMRTSGSMMSASCDPSSKLPLRSMMAITVNNTYYSTAGPAAMKLCGWGNGTAWPKLQAGGMENGSRVDMQMPATAQVITWGRVALGV